MAPTYAVTTAEANQAYAVLVATQPQADAYAETGKARAAAEKTLKAFMAERELSDFRRAQLSSSDYTTWDDAALREHLGSDAQRFRVKKPRRALTIRKRGRR